MKKSNVDTVRPKKIQIELNGQTYNFGYDLNSFAEIEDTHGSITELITKMEGGSIKAVRAMMWAGLLCNDNPPTEKEVGAMIQFSDMPNIVKSIQKSLVDAMPESDGTEKN